MKWAVVFAKNDADGAKQFVQALTKSGSRMGFKMAEPKPFQINDTRTVTYTNQVKEVKASMQPQI